jgi:hypothetical protein
LTLWENEDGINADSALTLFEDFGCGFFARVDDEVAAIEGADEID